jgi:hypothetical protein
MRRNEDEKAYQEGKFGEDWGGQGRTPTPHSRLTPELAGKHSINVAAGRPQSLNLRAWNKGIEPAIQTVGTARH